MAERSAKTLWNMDQRYPTGCGVYVIRCTINRRFYIGSTEDLAGRLSRHFTMLRGRRHENGKLQNHFNKYGEAQFACELLELCSPSELEACEQRWIDHYWSTGGLLNLIQKAGRPPKFSELDPVVRERKREAHRKGSLGRVASEKSRANTAQRIGPKNPNYGTKWPLERVAAMRDRMRGSRNPGFGKKGKLSPLLGLKRSAETRALMSANNCWIGRGHLHPMAKVCKRTGADGSISFFGSSLIAARELGLGSTTVGKWCRGDRIPCDGSKWEYVE